MAGLALIVGAYLVGSIPFGLLIARRFAGVDVRQAGSGNIGATNVARTAGRRLGVAVLALDALKGALPALVARLVVPAEPWLQVTVGGAAIAGHLFPIYLRFRGGKGVATTAGVLTVLAPWTVLAGAAAFAVLWGALRIVAAGSMAGVLVACAASLAVYGAEPVTWLVCIAALFILWSHRSNLARMARGEERRM